MANENALLQMETSSTPLGVQLMTDLGDHQTFGLDGVDLFSAVALTAVRPNGVVAGVNMGSPAASGANDAVDVAAIVCMIKGVKTPVAADTDVPVTRPTINKVNICAVTVDEDGLIDVVVGTDGDTFSPVRGTAGGPPLIPVDSTELFLVKLDDDVAVPIKASQIVHTTEFAETFDIDETGRGDHAEFANQRRAHVRFGRVLPLIHTGGTTRRVYIDVAEPNFTDIAEAVDFVPAEETASMQTTSYYRKTSTGVTFSTGEAGFKSKLKDGVSDMVLASRRKTRLFRFYPDMDQSTHLLTIGLVTVARTFPNGGDTVGAVKIAAKAPSVECFID